MMNIRLFKRKFSRWLWLLLCLPASLIMWACGGSQETPPNANSTRPISNAVKPSVPASDRMAIPFDIAIQAALSGHDETIDQALETGTDPNQIDGNGRTLLMMGAFNGHNDIVRALINAGAKLDVQDFAGRTALMYAATGKNKETVALLLEHKAKVDLVDAEEHFSALMFAAAEGNTDVVRLLLEHNADTTLEDTDGETAEEFARSNGHTETADVIKNWAQ